MCHEQYLLVDLDNKNIFLVLFFIFNYAFLFYEAIYTYFNKKLFYYSLCDD